MKKIAITIISLFVLSVSAFAQRFSVGTNAVDLLSLGTLEAEASVAVSQHWSFHVGAELNPWTWNAGDQKTQLQSRQNSYWGGARYWPWHVYSGWWWGADARYSVYNVGYWNLDLGVGLWGGWTNYTRYACPVCGTRVEEGTKPFILPDARIAIQLIF